MMYMRLFVLAVSLIVLAGAQGPEPGPPGPTPGAGCSSAMDKKGCGKEKGCVWCEGSFSPGSCYEESQAKFLPKQFFKCKKPKKVVSLPQPATAADPNPEPTPGADCSGATDEKGCGEEKGCLWCEGSFGPGSCCDEAQAKLLPKQVYKCKKPKPAAAAAAAAAADPNPEPIPGAGCSSAMDKKGCGKEKGCVWCEGSFGPGSCYDEAQAKFLPKQFYKCKKPKPAAPSTDQQVPQVAVPSGDRNVGCFSMNKKTCEAEAGCVWCNCSIRPAKCYAEAEAKFLPSQFYKCMESKPAAA